MADGLSEAAAGMAPLPRQETGVAALNDGNRLGLVMLSDGRVSTGLLCGSVRLTVTPRAPGAAGSPVADGGTKLPNACQIERLQRIGRRRAEK